VSWHDFGCGVVYAWCDVLRYDYAGAGCAVFASLTLD